MHQRAITLIMTNGTENGHLSGLTHELDKHDKYDLFSLVLWRWANYPTWFYTNIHNK